MDKLMDNPWFIKIIALALAFLLYSSVPNSGNKLSDIYVPGEQTTAKITNVPVKAYYDTENLVVSGLPETVDVTIEGPITHVQPAKTLKNFEVYVDLTNAKVGTQKVKLHIRNLSDKLKATLNPEYVDVSIQEKITREFKVGAEYNNGLIADGFTAGQPIVEPDKVKITGAKDVIDRITYVKATLDLKQPVNDTISKDAHIKVLDRELNKLDVIVDPERVKVTIPVKNTSKEVPINVIQKGTPPSGVLIDSISLDTSKATIMGKEDVIKATDHVRVEVDVSKISDDTTLMVPVIIADGITKVSPQTVTATIKVKKGDQKTISSVPLKTKGLSNQYNVVFDDPNNGSISLLVSGPSDLINSANPDDFSAYVDLSNLTEGDHNVQIQIEGPPDINWNPNKSTAKITITKSSV
jgi:YbbR domain-containing protein